MDVESTDSASTSSSSAPRPLARSQSVWQPGPNGDTGDPSSSSSRGGFTDGPQSQKIFGEDEDGLPILTAPPGHEEEEWHDVALPEHLCDRILAGGMPDQVIVERILGVLRAQLSLDNADDGEQWTD